MFCKGRKASVVISISMRTIERMRTYTFPVVIEKDEDGFFVECPAIQGCATQGDTYEEAIENIKDAIKLFLEDMEENNEEIPKLSATGLPTVEVSI